MQNMIPKFRGSSVVSEEPGYSCEKLKTLTRFNYHRIFFFDDILHTFHTMSTKGCLGFFCVLFRSWVINKKAKNEYVETR